ncbi:interferon-induced protein 44-like [Clarias gariepinus]|uniref:interferon-induced protein 44-like n=1 Tax=Clarias gariepinus TaxID=13013 RepID=UPI00234D3245|nr:interferon-induced protein 44-like [Clarias gariepinus]
MGGKVSRSQAKSKNVPKSTPPKVENEKGRKLSHGPPEFDKEWRKMNWDKKHEIEQKLRDFKISNPNAPYVRILVVGEIGVGKSSFINSVNNAFQGRITCEALTATGSGKSFTTTYKTHYIEREDGSLFPFVFNDVMGLESEEGVQSQDIATAVQGFIQEGYKFNPVAALSPNDHGYRSDPALEEQTFCLVNILAADKVALMDENVIEKLKYIREEAKKLDMPQLIVMTRPDLACPLVNEDLRKIYTSKKIKEKMQMCSNLLGIPMNFIFPVKNYHEEIDTDDDMDLLILKALDQIVYIADDTMKKKCRKVGKKRE